MSATAAQPQVDFLAFMQHEPPTLLERCYALCTGEQAIQKEDE